MKITIVSVLKEDMLNKLGKPYQQLNVMYSVDGVSATQKIVSFQNPQVFKELEGLQKGEVREVKAEKIGAYTQWTSAGPVGTIVKEATKVIGSNYESAEERAVKQRYIVRQSSIANAIAYYNASLDKPVMSVDAIIEVAKQFEAYVFEPVLLSI